MRHVSPHISGPQRRQVPSALQGGIGFARADVISPGLLRLSAIVLSAAGLALMLISFQPFVHSSLVSDTGGDGGNIVNQVGFLAAGMVFALSMMCLANRKALASLLTPSFLPDGRSQQV